MLRVGVKLGAALTDAGEYLADVAALEAAGADSVWLDVKDGAAAEPWILLGAISTATQRVRVGMLVDASGGWPPPTDLLGRLTRGRLIVGIQRGHHLEDRSKLPASSHAPGPLILIACDTVEEAKRSARTASGVIFPGTDADVRALRAAGNRDAEVWVDIPIPGNRAAWAEAIAAHEGAGATGIIVPWDPRIIDLLRSGGEPDNRTDLLIATG